MWQEPKGIAVIDMWEKVLESVKYRRTALEYYAHKGIYLQIYSGITYLSNKEQTEETAKILERLEQVRIIADDIARCKFDE